MFGARTLIGEPCAPGLDRSCAVVFLQDRRRESFGGRYAIIRFCASGNIVSSEFLKLRPLVDEFLKTLVMVNGPEVASLCRNCHVKSVRSSTSILPRESWLVARVTVAMPIAWKQMLTQDRPLGGEDWEIVELTRACDMHPQCILLLFTLLDVQDSIITYTH